MYIPQQYFEPMTYKSLVGGGAGVRDHHDLLLLLTSLYLSTVLLLLAFVPLLTIFQPLARRLQNLALTTFCLLVPTGILLLHYDMTWRHAATTRTVTVHSRAGYGPAFHAAVTVTQEVSVNMGLTSASVELKERFEEEEEDEEDEEDEEEERRMLPSRMFHVHVSLDELEALAEAHRTALARGYPDLVLTVTAYLSLDQGGMTWGRQYRAAGHYANILLTAAFITWLAGTVLFTLVFSHGCMCMILCGILLLSAVGLYSILLPSPPLTIPITSTTQPTSPTSQLSLEDPGLCVYISLTLGTLCLTFGSLLLLYDSVKPKSLSVVLQLAERVSYPLPAFNITTHHQLPRQGHTRHIVLQEGDKMVTEMSNEWQKPIKTSFNKTVVNIVTLAEFHRMDEVNNVDGSS